MSGVGPTTTPPGPQAQPVAIAGPCAPARAEVDSRCAGADRLMAIAQAHQKTLREAKRQHLETNQQRDDDAMARDRRHIADEKSAAQSEYHAAVVQAADRAAVQAAAATWLRKIDSLNRQAREADERADALAQQVADLERGLPGLELAADAARISAEAAQVACLEARRTLAACEEASAERAAPIAASVTSTIDAPTAPNQPGLASPPATDSGSVKIAARVLMSGDRQMLLGLALRLAEETGIEAGRLQLVLLELREQIVNRALDDYAFELPSNHPFWSQFPDEAARNVAASLASMGFRFDGAGGWAESRSPQIRDLAMALSYSGLDPRSLRRPAGQTAVDTLWQGTRIRAEEYLLDRAPDLSLDQMVELLGPRSDRLAELWDIWGRLRPLLMRAN